MVHDRHSRQPLHVRDVLLSTGRTISENLHSDGAIHATIANAAPGDGITDAEWAEYTKIVVERHKYIVELPTPTPAAPQDNDIGGEA